MQRSAHRVRQTGKEDLKPFESDFGLRGLAGEEVVDVLLQKGDRLGDKR
jgi:hypothetical protein